MAYFTRGAFAVDPWRETDGEGRVVLGAAEWQERRSGPLPPIVGLKLDPGFPVETIAIDISRFALIAVAFPRFTDGRGYSMAWLLRARFGYRNELRATGDVLFDEMQLMTRCGFDTFDIEDAETLRLLGEGRRPAFDRFYQPGLEPEIPEGTRPWARRPAPSGGNLA